MKITNRLALEHDPGTLFDLLVDMDFVAGAIPGAQLLPATGSAGPRQGEIDVDMGVMRFRYAGEVELVSVDRPQRTAVFAGSGRETSGEGGTEARIVMRVAPDEAGSILTVDTDLKVTGPVARLGQAFIEDFAQQMMEDFGRTIAMEPIMPVLSEAGGRISAPTRPTAAAVPKRFNAMSFMARLMWRRLSRLVRGRSRAPAHQEPAPEPAVSKQAAETPKVSQAPAHAKFAATGAERIVDVLIAGSGSGALTAAITAAEAGLDVLICEKSSVIGGGSAYSGGVVWAPCNHIMKRKGIADTVDEALTYLDHASAGRGDPELQRRYVETVGTLMEQIEAWTGISWIIWPGQPDYYPDLPGASLNGRAILQHPASAHRVLSALEAEMPDLQVVRLTPHMDFVPGFQTSDRPARESWVAGRAVIGGLWLAAMKRNIPYQLNARVEQLLVEDGRVAGATIVHSDGRREAIRARYGVLLNTGGMDWNRTLTSRYLPGPITRPQTPPSNTGDGHIMATSVGAAVALMDKAVLHPAIRIPGDTHDGEQLYRMFNEELAKPHGILVNRKGKRFASESAYFGVSDAWNSVDQRTREFPNTPSYLVVDSQFRRKYGLPGVFGANAVPDWITTADTLETLAEALGIEAAGLVDEITTYNRDCEAGVDTRFGRGTTTYERYWGDADQANNPTMGTVAEAPFYAFEVLPSHAGTRGGVVITPDGQATRADGSIIRGLYACGNTAANLLFGAGYGSGSAVGSSIVFGHLAARRMIDEARSSRTTAH